MNLVAIAESTPGPIAVNMATFVGSSQGGFWGALLATLGVVLPSFIIIYYHPFNCNAVDEIVKIRRGKSHPRGN